MLTYMRTFVLASLLALIHSHPVTKQVSVALPVASSYSALVVFGDSLSDNGNGSYKTTKGAWAPPFYYRGRFSNGPVWNEYVANNLSIPLYNYAIGGSTTSNDVIQGYTGNDSTVPVPSTDEQVATFLNDIPFGLDLTTSLFAVTGGANDIIFDPNSNAHTSMTIIAEIVARLQRRGAQNFLFFSYPDLSLIPYDTYIKPYIKSRYRAWSNNFQNELEYLQKSTPRSHFYSLGKDLFPHFYYYGEPIRYGYDQLGAYGSCVKGAYREELDLVICNDADKHVFWDVYHPTTRTHSWIAAGILQVLGFNPL